MASGSGVGLLLLAGSVAIAVAATVIHFLRRRRIMLVYNLKRNSRKLRVSLASLDLRVGRFQEEIAKIREDISAIQEDLRTKKNTSKASNSASKLLDITDKAVNTEVKIGDFERFRRMLVNDLEMTLDELNRPHTRRGFSEDKIK